MYTPGRNNANTARGVYLYPQQSGVEYITQSQILSHILWKRQPAASIYLAVEFGHQQPESTEIDQLHATASPKQWGVVKEY